MRKITSKDGTSIAYNIQGSGPVLILIDGALSTASFGAMDKLVALLSSKFSVLTYDRRGRGKSADYPDFIPEKEVEDLEALITNVAKGPVYMCGFSSGAILTLFAASKKLAIEKIAMYEPPFQGGDNTGAEKHFNKIKEILASGDRGKTVKYFLHKAVGVPYPKVLLMSCLPVWKKVKALVHTLPHDLELAKTYNLKAVKLSSITIPALFVYGSKCNESMRNGILEAAASVENSEVKVLEGQTHNVSEKVLVPELIRFFKS